MSDHFKKVARLEIDVAFNSEAELEKFHEILCATKTDLGVKVVGDAFELKDVSNEYKSVVTPCTCNTSNYCERHGKHAYA